MVESTHCVRTDRSQYPQRHEDQRHHRDQRSHRMPFRIAAASTRIAPTTNIFRLVLRSLTAPRACHAAHRSAKPSSTNGSDMSGL